MLSVDDRTWSGVKSLIGRHGGERRARYWGHHLVGAALDLREGEGIPYCDHSVARTAFGNWEP